MVLSIEPLLMRGTVVHGFKRGSRELGIPTANLPPSSLSRSIDSLSTGVYFGFAYAENVLSEPKPMVMSIGWNPVYKNKEKTVEVHIMGGILPDFYGNLLIFWMFMVIMICAYNRSIKR